MSDPRQHTNGDTALIALWDASLALQGYLLCHGHPSALTMLAELEISCAGWHPLHWCGNRFPMQLRSASNTLASDETVEKACKASLSERLYAMLSSVRPSLDSMRRRMASSSTIWTSTSRQMMRSGNKRNHGPVGATKMRRLRPHLWAPPMQLLLIVVRLTGTMHVWLHRPHLRGIQLEFNGTFLVLQS